MPKKSEEVKVADEPVIVEVNSPVNEVVEQWFVETFTNRGLDTQLYNHIFAAKKTLTTRLAALVIKEK